MTKASAMAQARSERSPMGIAESEALTTPSPSTVSAETAHDTRYFISEQGIVQIAITRVPVLEKNFLQNVAMHIHTRKTIGESAVGGFTKRSAASPRLRAYMLDFLMSVKAVSAQTKQSIMSGTGFPGELKKKGNTELARRKHTSAVMPRNMYIPLPSFLYL